jgi:hypothetical protein
MNDNCPCIKCICLPICGGKSFDILMRDCSLVHDYYYFGTTLKFDDRLKNIVNILDPVWRKRLFNM